MLDHSTKPSKLCQVDTLSGKSPRAVPSQKYVLAINNSPIIRLSDDKVTFIWDGVTLAEVYFCSIVTKDIDLESDLWYDLDFALNVN